MIETFLSIDGLYWGLGGRTVFDQYAIRILASAFARVGWDRRPGEPDNVAVLREQLIGALGRLGDPAVIGEAQTRFASWRIRTMPAADADLYIQLYDLAKATVDPVAKEQYFVALAEARDKNLAQRSLDIALGNDPATTTGPVMISRVAAENAPLAWTFVMGHLRELDAKLDAIQRVTFVPSIAAQSVDKAILKQLREFIDVNVPAANKAQVERFYADLAFRLSVRDQRIPEIDAWLGQNG
jgi:aminopeptidase N